MSATSYRPGGRNLMSDDTSGTISKTDPKTDREAVRQDPGLWVPHPESTLANKIKHTDAGSQASKLLSVYFSGGNFGSPGKNFADPSRVSAAIKFVDHVTTCRQPLSKIKDIGNSRGSHPPRSRAPRDLGLPPRRRHVRRL